MSAYVVDNKTICALVKGFEYYGGGYKAENYQAPKGWIIDIEDERSAVGQSLLDQNYKSVNCRYGEDTPTPKFKYEDVKVDAGIIYGCIQCYEYQACETPDYWESELHYSLVRLQTRLLEHLLRKSNMKAPYGYDGHDILEF